ncbi:hypothetical protein QQ045_009673 [Rhodiola kirilowii]
MYKKLTVSLSLSPTTQQRRPQQSRAELQRRCCFQLQRHGVAERNLSADLMFSAPMETPPPTTITFDTHISSSDEEHRRSRRKTKTNRHSNSTSGKPRGRPYGSKNKPKPPIIITRNSPNTLTSHFMEIPPTHDIVQALTDFAANRHRGLCILTASGTVSNVSLRQPPPPQQLSPTSSVLNFSGRFEILSMSGAFLPPPAPPVASGLSVFLSGGQGQVLGGKVVGPLLAAGLVVVMAASFANSPYDRLPLAAADDDKIEDDDDTVPVTCEKIPPLIPEDQLQEQQQQQQQQLMMKLIPATTAASGGLFHGFGGNAQPVMPSEDFWGGAFRPPFYETGS